MLKFYLFIFLIEGISVHVLVLGIHYIVCAFASSSFCCCLVGRDCFMVPSLSGPHQPQWESLGESPSLYPGILMDRKPARWLPTWYLHYCAGDHMILVGLQKSWSICLICRREWELPAGVKPCRRNCHQPSQRIPSVTSLSEAFFIGRSSENVLPCLKRLLLVDHDFHDW